MDDEEHRAIAFLRDKGWLCFQSSGPQPRRPSAIAAPLRGCIALVQGHVIAELSPFDAEELGRDLVDLAGEVIAHPEYPS